MLAIYVEPTQGCAISLGLGSKVVWETEVMEMTMITRESCKLQTDYQTLIFLQALSHDCMLYCTYGISRGFSQTQARESWQVVCCLLLVVGLLLVVDCWLVVVSCWWIVVGCRVLLVGCWWLGVGCWVLVVSC